MARDGSGWGRRSGPGEPGALGLARDQVLRLPRWREGAVVAVQAGVVVVSREADPDDHVLQAGEALRVPGRGLGLVWALGPSRVEIRRAGPPPGGGGPGR